MTGFNMPPGCNPSDIPGFNDPDPSPLQEAVWAVLDAAGVPEDLKEQIDGLIAEWEWQQREAAIQAEIDRTTKGEP